MKRKTLLIVLALLLNFSFLINNCMSQWVQMSTGTGNNNEIIAFTTLGTNLFASCVNFTSNTSGVYRSTNNGVNWSLTNLNAKFPEALTSFGSYIYAGIYNLSTGAKGLYRSSNFGSNWTLTSLNEAIIALVTVGSNIIAGTAGRGIYTSTNSGDTWTQTLINNNSIISLASNGNNVFAGTNQYGVYRSTNNGLNWSITALNNKTIMSVATIGSNIFAGTISEGVYLSTNNGLSWSQTSLNNKYVISLASSGNNIFGGTYDYTSPTGIYLSTNNGINWIQKNQGFGTISSIEALLIANNFIFAGTSDQSVWRRSYSEIISIQNISTETPSSYSLSQNYPNPFNSTTKIKFDVINGFPVRTSGNDKVMLKVYDVMGREVQTLVNESLKPGTYGVSFDGSQLTSGVYFYKLMTGGFTETKKMLLLK